MRKYKRSLALVLALGLCLSLTACRQETAGTKGFTTYDAEVYVDGLIKENYMGIADEAYLELVNIHAEDVEALYDSTLDLDAEYFFFMYDIDHPTDELREEVRELYREIYKHTKYEIVSAAEQEDGSFSVKLNVSPIDIAQTVNEAKNDATEKFYEKYPQTTVNAMRDKDYEKMEAEWAELIMELYQNALKEIGNMTEKSISVQIEQNDEGLYTINSDDFARLDALIIDYTNMATADA